MRPSIRQRFRLQSQRAELADSQTKRSPWLRRARIAQELRRVEFGTRGLVESESPAGHLEAGADHLGVGALAAHAMAETRIVERARRAFRG